MLKATGSIQSISAIVVDALSGTVIISTSEVVSSFSMSFIIVVVLVVVVIFVAIVICVVRIVVAIVGLIVVAIPRDPVVAFVIGFVPLLGTIGALGNSVDMLTQS